MKKREHKNNRGNVCFQIFFIALRILKCELHCGTVSQISVLEQHKQQQLSSFSMYVLRS